MTRQKHIFLSYANADADFALQLAADLKNAGIDLWMDRLDVQSGDDWFSAVHYAVDQSAAMIPVLSPDYVTSSYCWRELARAGNMGLPIFPVLLRSWAAPDWVFKIQSHLSIDFSDWRDEEAYLNKLARLLQLTKRELPAQTSVHPDAEERYLNEVIARLEGQKVALERAGLFHQSDHAADEQEAWQRPHAEPSWGLNGPFSLVDAWPRDPAPGTGPNANKLPLATIQEAMERHGRLVLLGDPGMGKTTTLHRLALETAQARRRKPEAGLLPLFINLPDWDDDQSLEEFFRSQWSLESDPLALIAGGEIALFLDGLSAIGEFGPEKAGALLDWLHGPNPPQRVILTCRRADYTGDLNLNLPVVMVEALDTPRIRQIVVNYLGDEAGKTLLARLLPPNDPDTANPRARLARSPFLLSLLLMVFNHAPDEDLPRSQGALLMRLVVAAWERISEMPGGATLEELQSALAGLAFQMIDEGQPAFVPTPYALERLGSNRLLQAGYYTDLIRTRGGLLRFCHTLVQEYLAAHELSNEGLYTRLTQARFDDWGERIAWRWDHVVIALSGIAPNPDFVVLSVAEVDPYLAADCIASGIHISEATRQQVARFLLKLVAEPEIPGRAAAVRRLGTIREEKAVSGLLAVLREGHWHLSKVAAEALYEVGKPAIPGLVKALKHPNARVRARAISTLDRLGDTAAIPGLLEALSDTAIPDGEDRSVAHLAAEALEHLGTRKALAAVAKWRRSQSEVAPSKQSPAKPAAAPVPKPSPAPPKPTPGKGKTKTVPVPRKATAAKPPQESIMAETVSSNGPSAQQAKARHLEMQKREGQRRKLSTDLLEALDDADWKVRRTGVELLGKDGAPTAVPYLLRALDDKDPNVRWAAVKALEGKQDTAVVEGLLSAMRDDDYLVSDTAAQVLVGMGQTAIPGLIDSLRDEKVDVRGSAIEALGKIGDPSVVSSLYACLADTAFPRWESKRICDITAEALERIGTTEALETVAQWRSSQSETDSVRPLPVDTDEEPIIIPGADGVEVDAPLAPFDDESIAQGASAVETEPEDDDDDRDEVTETLARLIGALGESTWRAREVAARELREYSQTLNGNHDPAIVDILLLALNNADSFVRWTVVESLAWLGAERAIPALIEHLRDKNWSVRIATIRALQEMKAMDAVGGLLPLLKDEHHLVREAAAETLGTLGDATAVTALRQALGDTEGFVRRASAEALGVLGDSSVVPELTRLLQDDDEQVRWYAIEALGKIGDERAVPGLITCLSDTSKPEWEDRRFCDLAAAVLTLIGTPEAQAAVENWQSEDSLRI